MSAHLPVTACNRAVVRRNWHGRHIMTFEPQMLATWLYERLASWREVAAMLGHSPAYWNLIVRGKRNMSRREENELRLLLGLAPRGVTRIERMSTKALKRYLEERR